MPSCVFGCKEFPGVNCCAKERKNEVGEPYVESKLDPIKKYMYVCIYIYLVFVHSKNFSGRKNKMLIVVRTVG